MTKKRDTKLSPSARRLCALMKAKGWSVRETARQSAVGYQIIQRLASGKQKNSPFLHKVAETLDSTVEWILNGRHVAYVSPPLENNEQRAIVVRLIPVIEWHELTTRTQNMEALLQEETRQMIPLPPHENASPSAYIITIDNDSMADGFAVGDMLLVDPEVSADDGDFIICKPGINEPFVLRQLKIIEGKKTLCVLNPAYNFLNSAMPKDIHIHGVVVSKVNYTRIKQQ
jgi:SOS-response transcriptional repressor LexA